MANEYNNIKYFYDYYYDNEYIVIHRYIFQKIY